jgi:hypothetical protein
MPQEWSSPGSLAGAVLLKETCDIDKTVLGGNRMGVV